MSINIKSSAVALFLAVSCATVSAQDAGEFDLGSQRHELQGINPVPGKVVKRTQGTTVINPTPRRMTVSDSEFLFLGNRFKLRVPKDLQYAVPEHPKAVELAVPGVFEMKDGETLITVSYGDKAADKAGVPDHAEAYRLVVDKNGITITGRDRRGAIYGLHTLGQILKSPLGKRDIAPFCDITDWPELPHRGLVEGFYGTPWSHETRLALIDYLGANKMNTYVYGPKDDPYHSSPNWRKPYPADEAARIRELADRAQKAGVDFVWAIHPGKDIRWDDADRDSLVAKFEMMYDLGVRGFAVFFDDIEGIGTDPNRQTELLNYLNRTFVARKGDVPPLAVCPTEYSRSWINPRPGGANDIYGRTLDPDINVFYTGDYVCSDMTAETLGFMKGLIRRPSYYWWNFPVSDYCRNFLLQGPAYGLDTSVTAEDCAGVLSNPMEHGIASMPALYSLADYTWNPADYNPLDSWLRSLADVAGEGAAAKAYHDFAINAADTRTGYRRDESWEMPYVTAPDSISPADRATLHRLFTELRNAPATLRDSSNNKALVAELEPWLVQAEALAGRLLAALDLTESADSGAARWEAIVEALPTPAEQKAFDAHTLGTLRLLPFHRLVTDDAARRFYTAESGREPAVVTFSGRYPNLLTEAPLAMIDGDTATYYHSAEAQRAGDRIIMDLGAVTPVTELHLLQGRNDGDVDYFDRLTISTSTDGSTWTALTPDLLVETYDYTWRGEPVEARYIRLQRDDSSKRTHWTAIRELAVNPSTLEERGLASSDSFRLLPSEWGRAIDSNPVTVVAIEPTDPAVVVTLPESISEVTVLTGRGGTDLTAAWLDADGSTISFTDMRSTYNRVKVPAGARSMRLGGTAAIHEIILD